jgi:hypothetical protein
MLDHSWQTAQPGANSPIEQLLATNGFLYARSKAGQLFRLPAGSDQQWRDISATLAAKTAAAGSQFPQGVEGRGVTVMARVGNDVGVVVPGLGVFMIADAASEQPVWIQANSLGPPAGAKITCASEIGNDLVLGTETHGVWAYTRVASMPQLWVRLPLGGADSQPVRKLVVPPGDSVHLGVLTATSALILSRTDGESWKLEKTLAEHTPQDLTASKEEWSQKPGTESPVC